MGRKLNIFVGIICFLIGIPLMLSLSYGSIFGAFLIGAAIYLIFISKPKPKIGYGLPSKPAYIICPNCGKSTGSLNQFCPNCGSRLSGNQSTTSTVGTFPKGYIPPVTDPNDFMPPPSASGAYPKGYNPNNPQKFTPSVNYPKRKRHGGAIAAIIIFTIIILLGAAYWGSKSPSTPTSSNIGPLPQECDDTSELGSVPQERDDTSELGSVPQERDDTSELGSSGCDPSYPDSCIPSPPPDLDSPDVSQKRFSVVGSDPHGFDRDADGIGCES